MDFVLLNFWKNKDDISTTASIILDYKVYQKSVELHYGGNQTCNLTHKALRERWVELLSQFYKQYEKPVEVITFPEIVEYNESQICEKAMSVLKTWCKKSSIGHGLILKDYDLKGHLNFSNIKIDMDGKFQQCHERILLFNPANAVILTIYFAEDPEVLQEEVYNCVDEVNVLGLLLKDELTNSGVTVGGMVACSEKISHKNCVDCKNFIVSYDIFTSEDHFSSFWDSYIDQDKNVTNDQGVEDKIKIFEAIASKLLGFLAHLQFKTSNNAVIPIPQKNPKDNILEAELLLNRYQMEIVYSNHNRVLLTGSYGTGKTVVIHKKMELLQKTLKDKEFIYYINFEHKSDLDRNFRLRMKKDEKIKVLKGGFDLSYIIKSQILPKEEQNGTETIHLMVDEYDTQSLSIREAYHLTEIFTNQIQFKNSTIFIATQPIEISRVAYKNVKGKEQAISEEKHMLGELKKIMHVCNLKYVMRTTVEIYTLASITQNYLNEKSNQYIHNPQLHCNQIHSPPNKRRKISSTETSNNTMPEKDFQRIDHDVFYKLADTPNKVSNTNCQRLVSSYRYNLESKIGHNITGPLPQLIKVPESANCSQQMALIAFFLNGILKISTKRVAIIHFETKTPPWLKQLLQLTHFQGLKITSDPGKYKSLDLDQDKKKIESVLLTDYRCVKGLEFSHVLLLLSLNEYHLRQFIPEAMTRCMSNLSILIVPSHTEFSQSETFSALVNEWERTNRLQENNPILEIIELKFCSNPICRTKVDDYCKDGSNKCVHEFTKFYEDLYKEIKYSGIQSFQSDNGKEKEEAVSL